MIPAGYMLKTVTKPEGWVSSSQVADLYSLSECVTTPFVDACETWRHNGFWLYDDVDVIREIVSERGLAAGEFILFYYELYEFEFDSDEKQWTPVASDEVWPVAVAVPAAKTLKGFDVTTHYMGARPECSPLACNNLAADVLVNEHCLFASFDDARSLLDSDGFKDCEPGPYRIFAVYRVDEPVPHSA